MTIHRPVARSSKRAPLTAAAILTLFVVLLTLVLRPGSAVHLPLEPANLTHASIAGRCAAQLSATAGGASGEEATEVEVSGLGLACGGKELSLTLYGADGEALTSSTSSLDADANGTANVSVPAYTPADVAGAAATIGTWGVPVDWTYTPLVTAPMVKCTVLNDPTGTKTCEATDVRVDAWGYPEPTAYNFYATVTSPSEAEDIEWQLTLNLADPEFKLNANIADSNNGVALAPGWTCSALPMVELRGVESVNTKYVGGGKTVTAWIQGRASSAPTTGGSLFNCS